jgi:hypothetical protein
LNKFKCSFERAAFASMPKRLKVKIEIRVNVVFIMYLLYLVYNQVARPVPTALSQRF